MSNVPPKQYNYLFVISEDQKPSAVPSTIIGVVVALAVVIIIVFVVIMVVRRRQIWFWKTYCICLSVRLCLYLYPIFCLPACLHFSIAALSLSVCLCLSLHYCLLPLYWFLFWFQSESDFLSVVCFHVSIPTFFFFFQKIYTETSDCYPHVQSSMFRVSWSRWWTCASCWTINELPGEKVLHSLA